MLKIKAAFFDLDWTLYNHKDDKWDEESIKAIKELQKLGVKVFICTARPYCSFEWLGAFKIGIDWDGYIASAGGYCFADGKYLFTSKIENDEVERFIKLALENNTTLELVELKTRKLIAPLTKEAEDHYAHFKEFIPNVEPYQGEDVEGINFFCDPSLDELFLKEFPNLRYWRYSPTSVDVMPFEHQKGNLIKVILDYYGIKKDEAIAFGDDLQDISMAENVKYFIALGNAKEEVKAVASYITDEVWNSGVAKAIKKIINEEDFLK